MERLEKAQKIGLKSFLNIGSISGLVSNIPQPQVAYNASKAAVHMLTKSGIKAVTDISNLHPLLLQNAASGPWPNEPPSIPIDNESPVKTCFIPKK